MESPKSLGSHQEYCSPTSKRSKRFQEVQVVQEVQEFQEVQEVQEFQEVQEVQMVNRSNLVKFLLRIIMATLGRVNSHSSTCLAGQPTTLESAINIPP